MLNGFPLFRTPPAPGARRQGLADLTHGGRYRYEIFLIIILKASRRRAGVYLFSTHTGDSSAEFHFPPEFLLPWQLSSYSDIHFSWLEVRIPGSTGRETRQAQKRNSLGEASQVIGDTYPGDGKVSVLQRGCTGGFRGYLGD
jgi:hypothetical protein